MKSAKPSPVDLSGLARNLTVVGLDPSLRNWGIARGVLTPQGFGVSQLKVINPLLPTGKQVRQNSLDLESAKQLADATMTACMGADVVFVEVPVGSQSARAMASYGICVGVLGAIRGMGYHFIEVSPNEVKLATTGKATATKLEMIEWAMEAQPAAPWPLYSRNDQVQVSQAKAEHMADAIAAIYAGLRSNTFQQLLPAFRQAA